jgi:RsmE family RNA methyltransferase
MWRDGIAKICAQGVVVNIVLLESDEVGAAGVAEVRGVRAEHVANVLGAAPGREVRIGIVDGPIGTGVVRVVSPELVVFDCRFDGVVPPRPPVDVVLALPRPKVMQRLWAQLAALGVGRIVLTNAERVERHYFDTHVLEPETYRSLLIEGLQQARDTRVPIVTIHKQFRVLVEDELDGLCSAGLRLVAQPGATGRPGEAIAEVAAQRVVLAIGPEGGWNAFEMGLLESRGFTPVALGARRLRSDTATVALLAIVHEALALRRE